MYKVNCVIVTFNRCTLLKKCVDLVQRQTHPIQKIIIVNNASTDNTREYLKSLTDPAFVIINLERNTGGAGGFNTGIKESLKHAADCTWIMDDDTLPKDDTLELLITHLPVVENPGFLCSRVLWTDGTIHKMNHHLPDDINDIPYIRYYDDGILLQKSCSFVSCLLTNDAVRTVGFPISDFFLWYDDVEYTERIIAAGFLGAIVPRSIVVHATKANQGSTLQSAAKDIFPRFFYDQRNRVFLLKKQNSVLSFPYKYFRFLVKNSRECLKNKNGRFKLLYSVLRGIIAGLFFNPKIERCKDAA